MNVNNPRHRPLPKQTFTFAGTGLSPARKCDRCAGTFSNQIGGTRRKYRGVMIWFCAGCTKAHPK
jgi:hypothetical protein